MKIVSCRPAWVTTSNRFTNLFAQAVQDAGWDVREFSWGPAGLFAPKVILLHWPDELFTARSLLENAKALAKLALLRGARMFGARLVWVVHETSPHDRGRPAKWSSRAFLKSLDGAIYLSHTSRCAGEADIAELSDIPALVTRHGHYRIAMERPPQPRRAPGARLDLVYFGQIRPYKNLDSLLSAARGLSPDEVRLKVIGWSKDPEFTRMLERLAAEAPAVSLDIRESLVPQLEIEEALDAADGVVLPYRRILNSGAALFALSRNRPILAPRLGTLPELRDEIGAEWVDLYDGEAVTTDILAGFGARLREQGAPTADLSFYDWGPIGESIGRFFDHLSKASVRSSSSHLQTGSETPWR